MEQIDQLSPIGQFVKFWELALEVVKGKDHILIHFLVQTSVRLDLILVPEDESSIALGKVAQHCEFRLADLSHFVGILERGMEVLQGPVPKTGVKCAVMD